MALSPQDFEKLKNRLGGTTTELPTNEQQPPVEAESSLMSRIGSDLSGRVGDVATSIKKEVTPQGTPLGGLRLGLRTLGAGAGGVVDVLGETLKSASDVTGLTPAIKNIGIDILETDIGKAGLSAIKGGAEAYSQFKQNNPDTANALEDVLNIASLLPIGEGARLGAGGVKTVAKAGTKTADDLIKLGLEKSKSIPGGIKDVVSPITTKATDLLTPIETGVETVLKKPESLGKLEKYAKQAEIAVSDYSQKTPLELAGEEAQKAITAIQKQMGSLRETKKALTGELASKNVSGISKEVITDLQNTLIERLGIKSTEKGFSTVKGRLAKVSDKADLRLIKDIENKLRQAKTFQQLDEAIDFSQGLLFKRSGLTAVPVNTQVQGILKGTIKKANDMLKKVGGAGYEQANIKLSNRIQVYSKLNKALGSEGNKGASLMKQLFSPTGTAPRKLFQSVKELTGIDLVDEATLAKFVMENVGDARQASLLEEVIRIGRPTPTGLIGKAAEKVISKLQKPIEKARRISTKAQGL